MTLSLHPCSLYIFSLVFLWKVYCCIGTHRIKNKLIIQLQLHLHIYLMVTKLLFLYHICLHCHNCYYNNCIVNNYFQLPNNRAASPYSHYSTGSCVAPRSIGALLLILSEYYIFRRIQMKSFFESG